MSASATYVPPQNIEMEESVLGAMMVAEPTLTRVIDEVRLSSADFYLPRHGLIFEAIHDLYGASKPVDELSVVEALAQRNKIDEAGGKHYVSELAAKVPAAGNAKHYAEIVQQNSLLRRLLGHGQNIQGWVNERDGESPAQLCQRAFDQLQALQTTTGESAALLTLADLAELPPPSFTVEDMISAGGFNVLFGPSGGGKTFLALDFALCAAYGVEWWGQAVRQGPIAYVAAEGVSALHIRVEAWKASRRIAEDSDAFFVFPEAVNFFSDETTSLVAAIDRLETPPTLIVVDTMARCMVGGDENSARDVGLFIDGVDRVRNRYEAACLVLHHTGKSGELERGSSALRGASDTMILLKPEDGGLKLTCSKQKEKAEFDPWYLHLAETGESVSIGLGTNSDQVSAQETQILEDVSASFETNWTSATKIIEVTEVPRSSVYRSLNSLVQRGFIDERPVNDKRSEYRVSALGLSHVPERPKSSHETGPDLSHRLHPFRGGTEGETAGPEQPLEGDPA
jgi:hypothetical protein